MQSACDTGVMSRCRRACCDDIQERGGGAHGDLALFLQKSSPINPRFFLSSSRKLAVVSVHSSVTSQCSISRERAKEGT